MKPLIRFLPLAALVASLAMAKKPTDKATTPQLSPLEQYVQEVKRRSEKDISSSPGSLFSSTAVATAAMTPCSVLVMVGALASKPWTRGLACRSSIQ